MKSLAIEKHREILIVKINRAEVLNALNFDVVKEFSILLNTESIMNRIKCIIITGAGEKSFCSGGDLKFVAAMTPIEAEQYASLVHNLLNKIENLDKPVIAAINGFALGGGLELAMGCDFRIASSKAKFGQPEVNLGLIPGYAGTQRLPRLTGIGDALYLLMTADMIDANDALRIGLVQKVVDPEELMETVMDIAQNIISKGPKAVSLIKKVVRQGMLEGFNEGSELEADMFGTLFKDEGEPGMKAFLEKRKPEW